MKVSLLALCSGRHFAQGSSILGAWRAQLAIIDARARPPAKDGATRASPAATLAARSGAQRPDNFNRGGASLESMREGGAGSAPSAAILKRMVPPAG
jgi:hypothetical protein